MSSGAALARTTGAIMSLFEYAPASLAKSPRVREVLSQIPVACGPTFKRQADLESDFSIANITSERLSVAIAQRSESLRAIFDLDQWPFQALVLLDRPVPMIALELMFGGDLGDGPVSDEISGLGWEIAQKLVKSIATAIEQSLAGQSYCAMSLCRIEGEAPRPVSPSEDVDVICIDLRCALFPTRPMVIVLPEPLLKPIQGESRPSGPRQSGAPDPAWSRNLERRLLGTQMRLEAYIYGAQITIGELDGMEPGMMIPLEENALEHVIVEGAGVPVYTGQLGQSNGRYTISVSDLLSNDAEDRE